MTLVNLIKLGKAMELSESQSKEMNNTQQEDVNKVSRRKVNPSNFSRGRSTYRVHGAHSRDQTHPSTFKKENKCYRCDGKYPHTGECPAIARKCYNCNRIGHFSKCCRKPQRKRVQKLEPGKESLSDSEGSGFSFSVSTKKVEPGKESLSDSEGSGFSFIVSTKYNFEKIPTTKLKINGVVQTIMIDSGATINVMDEKMYEFVKDSSVLEKSNAKLYPYGSTTPLPLLGKIKAEISTNKKSINDIFYVVKNSSGCLLSFSTAKKLEIINIVNTVKSKKGHTLIDEFDCLFKGLGKLKNFQLKLNIDDTVQPVHQKHRRISFSTRDKVKMEIDQLYKEDICEDVGNDPTPWVSPIVVVPKTNPNKVRICVDMRAANEAIKRVKHPMPTLDEIIHDLNGCKVFSKLDLNQAYHQIELHPESRYITTLAHIWVYIAMIDTKD